MPARIFGLKLSTVFTAHIPRKPSNLAGFALMAVMLVALAVPCFADVEPSPLTVHAPNQVNLLQPFSVQVSSNQSLVGAVPITDGSWATLMLVDDDAAGTVGLTLDGTLQSRVVSGAAVFPNVIVKGDVGTERTVRLVAVAVAAGRSISGVSDPIQIQAPPPPVPATLGDRTFGGIGVDVSDDNGTLKVNAALKDLPAYKAGVRAGDHILQIDGKPVVVQNGIGDVGLSGAVGTPVAITIRHKGAKETRDLTIVRAPITESAVAFDSIGNQMNLGVFQISVLVQDTLGRPLPGALVTVGLDSKYSSFHLLFISCKVYLQNGSGANVDKLSAVTGADGRAMLWVRLGCNGTPFKSRLTATARLGQQTSSTVYSNTFTVYDPDE